MKKLILILSLIATQMHGQTDIISLERHQEWILSKEGTKVGNGVCITLVSEYLKFRGVPLFKNGERNYGEKIKRKDLEVGDIVLFEKRLEGDNSHIGIFAGFTDDDSETMILAHQNTMGELKLSVVVLVELVGIEENYKKVTYYRPKLDKK